MEFLAESIGLLDIDGGAYASPHPHRRPNETVESSGTSDGAVAPSVLSSFFGWGGESSADGDNNDDDKIREGKGGEGSEDGEGDCFAAVDEEDISPGKTVTLDATKPSEARQRIDSDQDDELGISSMSLLSSLTPSSPMTLSASSLNLVSTFMGDKAEMNDTRCCSDDYNANSDLACNPDHDVGVNYNSQPTNEIGPATSNTKTMSSYVENVLTKHVTQRIDARTNYDCFTGNVDALTGHLIHGTMLYRQTGTVYEGSFITTQGQCTDLAGENTTYDTISLRHGENGTCTYPNGMKFIGTFEMDHPKNGTWIGGDWSYEGPLIRVQQEERINLESEADVGGNAFSMGDKNEKYGSFGSHPLTHHSSSVGSDLSNCSASFNSQQCSLRVIGIPQPLPGSVLFHGNGRFARSDGLVYKGEFDHGVANGVGKETLPNGQGVYQGEFANGLRHGVGTLIEDYHDVNVCACHHNEQLAGNVTSALDNANSCNESLEDNANIVPNIDTGPDFAAGCVNAQVMTQSTTAGVSCPIPTQSNPANIETTQSPQQCSRCNPKTRKKRYSSGVWCAGQYEIEDCRGTVHPQNNEFTEESLAVPSNIADTGSDGNCGASNEVSLNRTTWDMLDEKWLGI